MDNLPESESKTEAAAPPAIIPADAPASAPLSAVEILATLAEASKARRLPPADEDRAAALLQELLAGGRAGINSALAPLLALPWIVGVNAVAAAWPGLKPLMRRHLFASLAKDETEQAHRLRLSLARAIFKLEPEAGLKLVAAAIVDLKDPKTGELPPKHRQIFFNVFIGKGKPWLLQLPLGSLKGAEADALVSCAIETFPFCPPLSQLSMLRWIHGAGRFKKLSPANLDIVTKSISRWNLKLQRLLKTDVPELPEGIAAVLKPEASQAAPALSEADGAEKTETEETAAADEPRKETESGEPVNLALRQRQGGSVRTSTQPGSRKPVAAQPSPVQPAPEAAAPLEELKIPSRTARLSRVEPESAKDQPKPEAEKLELRPREDRREERQAAREVREVRDDKARRPFDFKESLRGLESYVAGLRAELEQAKAQLRRREEEPRKGGRIARGAEEKPSVDTEALIRHNAQLESTTQQLRQQMEDLMAHHEAVAESRMLHTDAPLEEGSAEQLKSLLAIKLKESYATYTAMRAEPLDKVFRLDYRDLLGSVLEVLLAEGIKLETK